MGKHWKHLTETDRYRIEKYLNEGMKVTEIADKLRVHRSTIYNELKRGKCIQQTYEYTFEERYCPDVAQRLYRENLRAKGTVEKIGNDHELANYLEDLMLNHGYSPGAAVARAKNDEDHSFSCTLCKGTIYNYIRKGLFRNLTSRDLPCKGEHKQKYHHVRIARAPRGESIENRPEEINGREEPFHWEMDTVVGRRGTKKSLLVLTERVTRYELIFLLKQHTAENVVRAIDSLERRFGSRKFREIFRSITIDNGSEFADCNGIERSCLTGGKRTTCYYCHPYSSWERGSNENQNRMIRRHFPKGTSFDKVTNSAVKKVQEWLNSYPREILGWGSSGNLFGALMEAV